jgi:hypothetical protein
VSEVGGGVNSPSNGIMAWVQLSLVGE